MSDDYSYQPRAGMCLGCEHRDRDCSYLDFSKMYVIRTYTDSTASVKCTEYKPVKEVKNG